MLANCLLRCLPNAYQILAKLSKTHAYHLPNVCQMLICTNIGYIGYGFHKFTLFEIPDKLAKFLPNTSQMLVNCLPCD